MAKKKKTQLKPVARGFATTSMPKKPTPAEEINEDSVAVVGSESLDKREEEPSVSAEPNAGSPSSSGPTLEQELRELVDKLQDKTEREVTRILKNVETERRFSKTLPLLDLDTRFLDATLNLILEDSEATVPEDPAEKMLPRLGITYGVLRRLGFGEERVLECLSNIGGVDLEDAYDWLSLHCSAEELTPLEKRVHTPRTPHTPVFPETILASKQSTISSPQKSSLDALAPEFIPKSHSMGHNTANDPSITMEPRLFNISEDDHPSLIYVHLRLKLDDLADRSGHTLVGSDHDLVKTIRSKMNDIQAQYFFDAREAEELYHTRRTEIDALRLRDRLRGVVSGPLIANITSAPILEVSSASANSSETPVDVSDLEEDSEGMFALLEELPTEEVRDNGTVVTVRDLALPKHWAGPTPRQLLRDAVLRADKYAAVSFRSVSGGSRVQRSAVTVTWAGGKLDEWIMEDVGCSEATSAEHYVALLALHAITFPSSDGFAGGHLSGSTTFFRTLPAVFRDIWNELEAERKITEGAINRSIWANLKAIIDNRQRCAPKGDGKSAKLSSTTSDGRSRYPTQSKQTPSEELRTGLLMRQATPEYQHMLLQRNSLPIAQHRQVLLETLDRDQVYVLCGETGCGKSTQLPAYILEHELSQGRLCKAIVTEPRRISAISLAERVNEELGFPRGAVGSASYVGYGVRLESKTSKHTRLSYVTNGIALRMLEGSGFDEVTHVIVDEVHERTIESDFLLIALKLLIQQRRDLKVILMSATLDAEKVSQYFGNCPIINVPGRTYPVDVRFLEDAVELTKWAVKEDSEYAKRYHDKYSHSKTSGEVTAIREDDDDDARLDPTPLDRRYSTSTIAVLDRLDDRVIPFDLIVRLLELVCLEDATMAPFSLAILIFMPGLQEIRRMNDMLAEHPIFSGSDFVIYPLHSTITGEGQSKVFVVPPPGVRKIVISTNIAETGVTIPDVTCVIDTGKHREMRFDEKRQISRLVETYIAKSNAAQRRGRAGRVRPGLCFHLMTRSRHDLHLAEHPIPEMMRLSLSDLALRIKIVEIQDFAGSSIEDVLSRALDPPSALNIQRAVSALVEVRALTPHQDITPMGRLLSKLPMDVHLGKFLLAAAVFRTLDPALTIAAALNSKSPFTTPFGHEQEADRAKIAFDIENSDFSTLHAAFSSWRRALANPGIQKFCRINYISHQTMQQIEELRQQYCSYLIDSGFIQVDPDFKHELSKSRYGRYRTRSIAIPEYLDENSSDSRLLNAALAYGLYPKLINIETGSGVMKTLSNNQPVQFHPTSVNFKKRPSTFGVDHLIYFTIMHSKKKLYAWQTGIVDNLALSLLCGEADFKLASDMVWIDRKLKYRASPKTLIALKHLRQKFMAVLSLQFRGKPLPDREEQWKEMAMRALRKSTADLEELQHPSVVIG